MWDQYVPHFGMKQAADGFASNDSAASQARSDSHVYKRGSIRRKPPSPFRQRRSIDIGIETDWQVRKCTLDWTENIDIAPTGLRRSFGFTIFR
jgi:hypothetical protein